MFQIIEGKKVYVVDIEELPVQRITAGLDLELAAYAAALEEAVRAGIVSKPGKYAIEVQGTMWRVFAITEPTIIETKPTLFVKVTKLLEAYDLLDDTAHIKGCGYTDENPNCECAKFGLELWEMLRSQK